MSTYLARNDVLLSTMYLQQKTWTLDEFVQHARAWGFQGVELSHIITEEHIPTLTQEIAHVHALHAPAPTRAHPRFKDAMRLISSPDEEERRWAVEQVTHSIRWAAEHAIPVVCVHLGTIEGLGRAVWALEQRFLAGQRHTPIYARELGKVQQMRAEHAPRYIEAVRRSLESLAVAAEKHGVRIGLESRRYPHEIPNLEEAVALLAEHNPTVVGFWYDMGHCRVTANLGFASESDWLTTLGDRIVGVHMHDVVGLRDHLLPGMGEIDFIAKTPYIPPTATLTWEVDWYFTEEELRMYRKVIHEPNA